MFLKVSLLIISILLFITSFSAVHAQSADMRSVHVFVALCDNENQGIVPVTARLGNGTDPANNLYWGALYGVKTFFSRSHSWQTISEIPNPTSQILERVIFKHDSANVYLIADAWRGDKIKQTIHDFLKATAGENKDTLNVNHNNQEIKLTVGGASNLLVYVGHNGLMEFDISPLPEKQDENEREAIVLACISKSYFAPIFEITGARQLLVTTGLMAPEAYTLAAALAGWIKNESPAEIKTRAAERYKTYQKCSIKAARNLFTN